jgi:mannose-6-phosphate isomerase-like protein (cupin superfamily)
MRFLLLLVPAALLMGQRTVPVDNEFVRVLSVVDQPVSKPGAMHEHKENRVMIYLDSGDIQVKYADGKVDNQHWKAGDVAWSPANGMHTSQNVSSGPVRIIEIEVKAQGGGKGSGGNALIDNPQVKVYRTSSAVTAKNYVAVDVKTASVQWNKMPEGPGPFIVTELKPQLHGDTEPR